MNLPPSHHSETSSATPEADPGNSPPDAVLVIDGAGVVTAWDATAASLFGVSAADAVGQWLEALPLPRLWPALIARARDTGAPERERTEIPGADGIPRALEIRAIPLPGATGGVLLHCADATASDRRQQLLSVMGHELRSPLTALVGYSELLLDGIVGELSPRQAEMVGRMSHAAGELVRLLNDVLELARLDAGRVELNRQSLTLGPLVNGALAELEGEIPVQLAEFRPASAKDAVVEADAERVAQILACLLRIAPPGRMDEARVWCEADGEGVRVAVHHPELEWTEGDEIALREAWVRRTGPATSPGARVRFLRLALAGWLARAMGGSLDAENGPGAAVTFFLFLPRSGRTGKSGVAQAAATSP